MKQLRAHLVAQLPSAGITLEGADAQSVGLSITGYDGMVPFDGFVHLSLYPYLPAINLVADIGEIQRGDPYPLVVPAGVVTFGGSQQAQLPKRPSFSSPTLRTLFAFDENGRPTSASIRMDVKGNLTADKPIHASVSYTQYTSQAEHFIYKPVISSFVGGGSAREFGTIAAFYPPSRELAVYQPQPITFFDGDFRLELYRIVSYAVATPEGEFELPPNYPTDGNFPSSTITIDPAVSLKTERVHEIGYMDSNGRGFSRSYYVRKLQPYDSDPNYSPIKTMITTTLGNDLPVGLRLKALNLIRARGYGTV